MARTQSGRFAGNIICRKRGIVPDVIQHLGMKQQNAGSWHFRHHDPAFSLWQHCPYFQKRIRQVSIDQYRVPSFLRHIFVGKIDHHIPVFILIYAYSEYQGIIDKHAI